MYIVLRSSMALAIYTSYPDARAPTWPDSVLEGCTPAFSVLS